MIWSMIHDLRSYLASIWCLIAYLMYLTFFAGKLLFLPSSWKRNNNEGGASQKDLLKTVFAAKT